MSKCSVQQLRSPPSLRSLTAAHQVMKLRFLPTSQIRLLLHQMARLILHQLNWLVLHWLARQQGQTPLWSLRSNRLLPRLRLPLALQQFRRLKVMPSTKRHLAHLPRSIWLRRMTQDHQLSTTSHPKTTSSVRFCSMQLLQMEPLLLLETRSKLSSAVRFLPLAS